MKHEHRTRRGQDFSPTALRSSDGLARTFLPGQVITGDLFPRDELDPLPLSSQKAGPATTLKLQTETSGNQVTARSPMRGEVDGVVVGEHYPLSLLPTGATWHD